MLVVELVHNAALLVSLIIVYRLIMAHYERSHSVLRKFSFQVGMGGLFGAACMVGMMTPVQWLPGIFFDGRTIILSVAALFTGAIPALVAGGVAAIYRLWIGGAGVWVGIATILQAVVLGLAYRALLARSNGRTGWLQSWAFGLVVHVVMLATFLWLPEGEGWSSLQKLGLPVLLIYPLTTMLLCRVFQDYDERSADQDALQRSESRFRSFMDNTPVYAYIKGMDLRIVYTNSRVAELLRSLAPKSDGTRTGDFFHPDVTQKIEAADRAILSGAQTRVEVEYPVDVDGKRRWLHDVKFPLLLPGGERGVGGLAYDVTVEKEAQEALRRSVAFHHSTIASFSNGFAVIDCKTHKVIMANDAYGGDAVCGKACHVVSHQSETPCDSQDHPCPMKEVCTTGAPKIVEHIHPDADGTPRYVEVHMHPIYDEEGRVGRVIEQTIDITERKHAERALTHSCDLMRYIIEHANSGVAVHDRELRYVYVSEHYKRQFHVENEDLIGRHHYDIFPDLPETWKTAHQRALAGETVRSDRDPFEREDGSIQWTRWECRPWHVPSGEIGGILVYTEVITEQVLAEQDLARQKTLLETIYRNAPLVMMVVDEQRRIRQVNSFAEQASGRTETEMLGMRGGEALRCLHALEDPRGCGFGASCQGCAVRQTVLDTLTKGVPHAQVEASLPLQRDGKTHDFVFLLSTAPLEHEGERMALVTFLDITERKESEENFTTLFENINVGVAVYEAVDGGEDFVFQDLNKAGQHYSKLGLGDVLGRRVTEVFPAVEEMGLLACFRKVYHTGEPALMPMTLYKDNRITEWVENRVVRLPSGRIVALYDDRTELHQLEENLRQMQKMDAIGQLAGGIAHDFNNQLAGILGYGEMIQKKTADPDLQRYATQVVTAARRSADLTRKLLMFARKGSTHLTVVDIHALIHEVSDILTHSINKKITIQQNLHAEVFTMQGDASQLQNAFLNLAVNASDAMKEGGELIFDTREVVLDKAYCLSLPYAVSPGRFLAISVTDSGCGIPKENLERIFEPFFTTKDVGKGTGMGLAAVYGTIKFHAGAINVYSEVGRGTTFRVFLPLSGADKQFAPAPPAPTRAPYPAHILVVDDEPVLCELAREILCDVGYKVRWITDPEEALAYYQEHAAEIDLVLLDMVMPKMDGTDLFNRMQEVDPTVRVVLASGYSVNGAAQGLLANGVLAFVQKPFNQAELSAIVANALTTP